MRKQQPNKASAYPLGGSGVIVAGQISLIWTEIAKPLSSPPHSVTGCGMLWESQVFGSL